MAEVLDAFPGARRALFRKYHIGGCQSCGFQPTETLTELSQRNGELDVNEVIDEIKAGHEFDKSLEIEPKDLGEKKSDVRLLDVRTREEFEAVRIEGAEFVNQQLVQDIMSGSEKDVALVFVDHTGGQSIDAAAYFVGHGFTNAKFLRGGVDAWAQEVDTSMRRYRLENTGAKSDTDLADTVGS
ncbi:MAG: molybdopterin-synthase sulfurylase [Verrucomicrobiales bacterium]|nr:molybdopterin-synthase sulfurylase [Verrucomicrobiales bacterium]